MKRRTTVEDVLTLSPAQRVNLHRVWKPLKYDIAIASVCTDIENDIWSTIEFTVGEVKMSASGHCLLFDLRYLENLYQMGKTTEDTDGEGEFDAYISFNYDDCLPLLDIGQMIEILQYVNLNKYHFYMIAGDGTFGCELGSYNSAMKGAILKNGYNEAEFIDLIWGIIKSIL